MNILYLWIYIFVQFYVSAAIITGRLITRIPPQIALKPKFAGAEIVRMNGTRPNFKPKKNKRKKKMKLKLNNLWILIAGIVLFTAGTISAQTTQPEKVPSGKVLIEQSTANECFKCADERDALKAELKTVKDKFAELEKTLQNERMKFAETLAAERLKHSEEIGKERAESAKWMQAATSSQNEVLRLEKWFDYVQQHGRKKCGVLSICIQ